MSRLNPTTTARVLTVALLVMSACSAEDDEQPVDAACSSSTCSGHGTCTDTADGASCACDEGYSGASCGDCAGDYQPAGNECVPDVANRPPGNATDPSPARGAGNVSVSATLQWGCTDPDGDALAFDLYLGTHANPPRVSADQTESAYDPGTLEPSTTYHWRVDCKDAEFTTAGDVWSFATVCPAFSACADAPTVIDDDGNEYDTLQVCGQCWMAANLRVGILAGVDNSLSDNPGVGAQADDGNIQRFCQQNEPSNCNTYGGLYQWNEMMNYETAPRGICPSGWHVPTDAEWKTLEVSLGMSMADADERGYDRGTNQGSQLKIGGTANFDAPYGGYVGTFFGHYDFANRGTSTRFWTASATFDNAWYREVDDDDTGIDRELAAQVDAASVRCVKD